MHHRYTEDVGIQDAGAYHDAIARCRPTIRLPAFLAGHVIRPPFCGAFRLAATIHPADPVATEIPQLLAPSGQTVDWTGFYGFGGGGEILLTPHFGVRSQMDVVYNHPFNNILANGFWTMRYSVGLNLHAGKNILK